MADREQVSEFSFFALPTIAGSVYEFRFTVPTLAGHIHSERSLSEAYDVRVQQLIAAHSDMKEWLASSYFREFVEYVHLSIPERTGTKLNRASSDLVRVLALSASIKFRRDGVQGFFRKSVASEGSLTSERFAVSRISEEHMREMEIALKAEESSKYHKMQEDWHEQQVRLQLKADSSEHHRRMREALESSTGKILCPEGAWCEAARSNAEHRERFYHPPN